MADQNLPTPSAALINKDGTPNEVWYQRFQLMWDAFYTLTSTQASDISALQDSIDALTESLATRLTVASQAQMEAASALDVGGAPGNLLWHPGIAKAYVRFNAAGTILGTSYGVASVVSGGSGSYTVTLLSPMADTNYTVIATIDGTSTRAVYIPTFTSTTVFTVQTVDNGFAGATAGVGLAVYGDLP